MSENSKDKKDKKDKKVFRPGANMDADLQRELDEALGDMSLEELIDRQDTAGGAGGKKGKVIAVQGDDIFVDLGGKSQGLLPIRQFKEDEELPGVGDSVEVQIQGYDQQEGLLLLSRVGAVLAADWESLEPGQVVEARVTGHNKGGLELSIGSARAFMPISQIELFRVEDLTPYVGRKLTCQVTDVSEEDRNIILSRRAVLEIEAAEAREKAFAELKEGQVVRGVVRNIMPYGAFVDIGGMDGLLHVSDMSYSRVEDASLIVSEGQAIDVKVLKIDRDARKVSLGLKQVMPDPWLQVQTKYAVDAVTGGRVTRLADFGAFVELESGIEGLVPCGEMTHQRRIKHPSEVVSVGDVVKVKVLSIDLERKRIGLSIKRAGEDPWTGASVRWAAQSVARGVVTRITDFGAFVQLSAGVEGLIHISELSDKHVRSVGDVVSEGDAVEVRIISVDEAQRRISLSLKQASQAQVQDQQVEAVPPPAPKRKRPLKGGLE